MRKSSKVSANEHSRETGQAAILVVLILGTFLLGSLSFGVDLSNMWFHRQAAQTAADAACLAGATDLLFTAGGGSVPAAAHFTPSTTSTNCAAYGSNTSGKTYNASAPIMCTYAHYNGYDSGSTSTTAAGNNVAYVFYDTAAHAGLTGVTDPPTAMSVAYPYLKVTVQENVRTWFMSLLGRSYMQVSASCKCGVQSVKTAPPLLVLDKTDSSTFTTNTNSTVKIIGGPSRSIEVDSTSSGAQANGGTIDTSQAGPSYTGGDVAIVGTESASSGFSGGTTGHWVSPVFPIPDPYATVPAPTKPSTTGAKLSTPVGYHDSTYWCPDTAGCDVYTPGYYAGNITIGNHTTALFQNGFYYLDGNLDASGTGATMRNAYPGNSTTSQLDGVTFYFNAGIPKINGTPLTSTSTPSSQGQVDVFNTHLMNCDITAALPTGVPATLEGTALYGPCLANGTYLNNGSTETATSITGVRGLLMYYAHSNGTNPVPSLEGQGQMAFSGALYFHTTTGNVTLKLAGGSGSGTEILGEIVADQVTTTGTGAITMALSTKKIQNTLKVAMLE